MTVIGFCLALSRHLKHHENDEVRGILRDHPTLLATYKSAAGAQGNLFNQFDSAISSGNIQGLFILLENGFDLHKFNRFEFSPIESAFSVMDLCTVRLLRGLGCVYRCNSLQNFNATLSAFRTCDARALIALVVASEPEDFLRAYGEYICSPFFDANSSLRLFTIVRNRVATIVFGDIFVTGLNREFVRFLFGAGFVDTHGILMEATRILCFRDYPLEVDVPRLSETIRLVIDTDHGFGSDVGGFMEACEAYACSDYRDPLVVECLGEIRAYVRFRHRLPFLRMRVAAAAAAAEGPDGPPSRLLDGPFRFVEFPPGLFSSVMSYLV